MTETQIRRIYDFLAAMELAPACHSREEAFALVLVQKMTANLLKTISLGACSRL